MQLLHLHIYTIYAVVYKKYKALWKILTAPISGFFLAGENKYSDLSIPENKFSSRAYAENK